MITAEQWDAMDADERLAWLAKTVKKRDENWKNTLVKCNAAWGASKPAPPTTPSVGPTLVPVIMLCIAVFLLATAMLRMFWVTR
jgi:hypothetical protein